MSNLNDFIIEDGVLKRYTGGDTEITIPANVTEVGNYAFRDCNVSKLIIPDTVKYFDAQSIYGCKALEFNIYDNALYLGNEKNPFRFLVGIVDWKSPSCKIHECAERICNFAFNRCTPLLRVTGGESLIAIDACAFELCENLTDINLSDSICSIGHNAFQGCKSLKEFKFPKSLTHIGSYAFINVPIKHINIPASVTEIEDGAFRDCSEVESVSVDPNNKTYHSNGDCLIHTNDRKLIFGCQSSIIPSDGSVIAIGDRAFYGCKNMKSITVPDTVTNIGECAFADCSELESIYLPEKITSIGWGSFWACAKLQSIVLPKSLTKIEHHLFDEDTAIESVTMFDSVSEIEMCAFRGCKSLKNINLSNNIKVLPTDCFSGCVSLENIVIPSSVTRIGDHAFGRCQSLADVVIPRATTYIDKSAFYGANAESIVVESGNAEYHSNGNCLIKTSFKELIFGCDSSEIPSDGSVTKINESAFWGAKLTSIKIPDEIRDINTAFKFSELQEITIPQGVTKLKWGALYGCKNLTRVVIPASVVEIEQEVFKNCESLSIVEIYGVPKVANHAFGSHKITHFKAPGLVDVNGSPWWKEHFGDYNTYIAAFDNFNPESKIAKYAKKCYEEAFRAILERDRVDLLANFLSMWKKFDQKVLDNLLEIIDSEENAEAYSLLMEWKK